MKSANKNPPLLERATKVLAQCNSALDNLPPNEVADWDAWRIKLEQRSHRNVRDLVSIAYGQYVRKDNTLDQQFDGLYGLWAAVCVAASVVKGQKTITADSLLTPEDTELRAMMSDTDALRAVEECCRKTQEAEERVKQLQAEKDKAELDLLAAQEAQSILEKANAKLATDLAEAQRLLSDSKTQSAPAPVPVPDAHTALLAEVRKVLHETVNEITNLNRDYVREKLDLTDAVADAFRAMEKRPAVVAAILADDEARPIWKLVTAAIHLIPS